MWTVLLCKSTGAVLRSAKAGARLGQRVRHDLRNGFLFISTAYSSMLIRSAARSCSMRPRMLNRSLFLREDAEVYAVLQRPRPKDQAGRVSAFRWLTLLRAYADPAEVWKTGVSEFHTFTLTSQPVFLSLPFLRSRSCATYRVWLSACSVTKANVVLYARTIMNTNNREAVRFATGLHC